MTVTADQRTATAARTEIVDLVLVVGGILISVGGQCYVWHHVEILCAY